MNSSYQITETFETSPEGVLTYFLTKYLLLLSSIWLAFGHTNYAHKIIMHGQIFQRCFQRLFV